MLDPQITAALIMGGCSIVSGLIGAGIGFSFGRRHSILRFLKEYKKLLKKANGAILGGDPNQLEAVSRALVSTVDTWKEIQESLGKLLNGLVSELARALQPPPPNMDVCQARIRAIDAAFPARKLAIETALKRSKI